MTLFEHLPAVVFGWPSAFAGAGLLLLGLTFRSAWLAGGGAIASGGFCLYLSMNPFPFGPLGLVALACNAACPFAIHRGRFVLAVALVLPFFASAGVLLNAVMRQ